MGNKILEYWNCSVCVLNPGCVNEELGSYTAYFQRLGPSGCALPSFNFRFFVVSSSGGDAPAPVDEVSFSLDWLSGVGGAPCSYSVLHLLSDTTSKLKNGLKKKANVR